MSQGFDGSDPSHGAELMMTERPNWPKVVGIISIVWGSLGLTCSGCGVAGLAMQSTAMNMAGQGGGNIPPIPDVMKAGAADYASAVGGLLPGLLLLIAGIMLVNRKPAARLLHLAYAVLAIVMMGIGTWLAWQKQTAISAWSTQNADNFWAQSNQQSAKWAMIGISVGVLMGLAYPVFSLVWFGLVKRRAEDMDVPGFEAAA